MVPFRPVKYGKSNKRPLFLMGCSFTYGDQLKENETFSYQLSEYTNRTVYNYGISGASPREMLYILKSRKILPTDLNLAPEYIIYTYIEDQKRRLYMIGWPLEDYVMPKFKQVENKLIYENPKPTLFSRLKLLKTFYFFLSSKLSCDKVNDLLYLYLRECKKEIDKKFPNSKFVILVYSSDGS